MTTLSFRGAHDVKVWKSLSREQQKWVARIVAEDEYAVIVRESVACGWAFELGRAMEAAQHRSFVAKLFGV